MPLGRHGPAVPPGLKAQRGEGDPKPWANGVGSEHYGVTWLGCTWTTSREMRDEESFLRPHQETCTGSNAQGNLLQNSHLICGTGDLPDSLKRNKIIPSTAGTRIYKGSTGRKSIFTEFA